MVRYERNFPVFTKEEFAKIQNTVVCVVGCGGLGGYVIEMLARVGIGGLRLIDGDVFETSNLNRQLLSNEENLEMPKAMVAEIRVKLINSTVTVKSFHSVLDTDNGLNLLGNADIAIDALDTISSRLILQNICLQKNIPLIHGAIAGWVGQITTIFPRDNTLSKLYCEKGENSLPHMGNPSFSPAMVASVQVSECLKVIAKKDCLLRNKVLHIDLLSNEFFTSII